MIKSALAALFVLWSGFAYAQAPQPVIASGYDLGPTSVTGTPANSSHAAGTVVGPVTAGGNQDGLFIVPIARAQPNSGNSGIITQFALTSSGGSTGGYVARIWSRLPANTTCKDGTAFAGNFAIDDAFLVTPPFLITPAALGNATGDANTYASLAALTWDFKNVDGAPSQNAYVCLVTVGTDTADDNKAMRVMLSGPQD